MGFVGAAETRSTQRRLVMLLDNGGNRDRGVQEAMVLGLSMAEATA